MSLPNPLHRPYPDDVHDGEVGEVSAWLRADDIEPEVVGAPREDYFETLADLGRGATMTDDERARFMLQHDTHWL